MKKLNKEKIISREELKSLINVTEDKTSNGTLIRAKLEFSAECYVTEQDAPSISTFLKAEIRERVVNDILDKIYNKE